MYLTNQPALAGSYANIKAGSGDPNTMPLYAAIKNPYIADLSFKQKLMNRSQSHIDEVTQRLVEDGFDGVVLPLTNDAVEIVAFRPEQIKSAIGARA